MHKPQYNFSEGVLQKMALYATQQITEPEMIKWLYSQEIENPEQFLKERERLLAAIRDVINKYQDGNEAPDMT